MREARAGFRREIRVTAVGVLETIGTRQDGSVFGGFGHLGAYPAQLVVQRVADVEIALWDTEGVDCEGFRMVLEVGVEPT